MDDKGPSFPPRSSTDEVITQDILKNKPPEN